MIVTLGGGVGGSKFLHSLVLGGGEEIAAIVNTGDDIEIAGLHISPDIDINIYTLAGVIHPQGWGFKDESYACQTVLSEVYGEIGWFHLGDKDLATHIFRTALMKQGRPLSEITAILCKKWNIPADILPMSDDRVQTLIDTPDGSFDIQQYLILRKMSDKVLGVRYAGAERSAPAPGVLAAIERADRIILCPSNPFVSIGPILAVPGIREAVKASRAKVIAVSPLIGGKAVKGPLDRMMRDLGFETSPLGIASFYGDLLDGMVIDREDEPYRESLEARGLAVLATNTRMDDSGRKAALGSEVIGFIAGWF